MTRAKASIEKPKQEQQLFSITALSRKFNLDRGTVSARLEENGILPIKNRAKEKLYDLSDVEFILSRKEKESVQIRKLEVETRLKEVEYKKKSGEYASVAEFTEITQQIFGRLYSRLAVQLPGRMAARLHNAESAGAVKDLLTHEIQTEFNNLRDDFERYLGGARKGNS